MKGREAARRWAEALFNLESASKVNSESSFLLLRDNPKLLKPLQDPHVPREAKERVLSRLFEKDPLFLKFLKLLLKRGRMTLLNQISGEYSRLIKRHLGIKEVELQSAVPLSEPLEEQLATRLKRDLKREVSLVSEVDPKLLGGAWVAVENRVVDGTLKGRLDRLKAKLMELT